MGRPLRFLPRPYTTFEITCRCIQGRLLLRPSDSLNDLVLGVLGRALARYPQVLLHLFVVASNHLHLLLTVPDANTLSHFMCFVNSNIAREAGRLHRWREKFWGHRYHAIAVLDDRALLERVRYILSHGCKEDLVRRPGDWPGAQCVEALTQGKKLFGTWRDRTSECRARQAGRKLADGEAKIRYEVALSPLPCWEGLDQAERQRRAAELVSEIECEHEMRRAGKGVLGRGEVLRQDPHGLPVEVKRSRAPLCHSSEPELRENFRRAYRAFREAFGHAARLLRKKRKLVPFPDHSFPPSLGYWAPAPTG